MIRYFAATLYAEEEVGNMQQCSGTLQLHCTLRKRWVVIRYSAATLYAEEEVGSTQQ